MDNPIGVRIKDKEVIMKRIMFVLTIIFYAVFISKASFTVCDTRDPMDAFQEVVDNVGFENAVVGFIDMAGMEAFTVLITLQDKTEPIVRQILLNHSAYSPHVVGRACTVACLMELDDLLDQILAHAFNKNFRIHASARRAYVNMCPPDRFPTVLKLMELETKFNFTRHGLLDICLQRKIIDPDLLEQWRDDQLEKDKGRDTKLMTERFLQKIDEAIRSVREPMDHAESDSKQNESQRVDDTSEGNNNNP